jgi:hypothetical protein
VARARRADGSVEVEGLDDLRRHLRQLEDAEHLRERLKDASLAVAEGIVERARSRAAGEGRMAARAADSLTAGRQEARATVAFGGHSAPFAAGSEFGANRGSPRHTIRGDVVGWAQFQPWRGNGEGAGYWLYPTIRDANDFIVDTYGDALDEITAEAFPD